MDEKEKDEEVDNWDKCEEEEEEEKEEDYFQFHLTE